MLGRAEESSDTESSTPTATTSTSTAIASTPTTVLDVSCLVGENAFVYTSTKMKDVAVGAKVYLRITDDSIKVCSSSSNQIPVKLESSKHDIIIRNLEDIGLEASVMLVSQEDRFRSRYRIEYHIKPETNPATALNAIAAQLSASEDAAVTSSSSTRPTTQTDVSVHQSSQSTSALCPKLMKPLANSSVVNHSIFEQSLTLLVLAQRVRTIKEKQPNQFIDKTATLVVGGKEGNAIRVIVNGQRIGVLTHISSPEMAKIIQGSSLLPVTIRNVVVTKIVNTKKESDKDINLSVSFVANKSCADPKLAFDKLERVLMMTKKKKAKGKKRVVDSSPSAFDLQHESNKKQKR